MSIPSMPGTRFVTRLDLPITPKTGSRVPEVFYSTEILLQYRAMVPEYPETAVLRQENDQGRSHCVGFSDNRCLQARAYRLHY